MALKSYYRFAPQGAIVAGYKGNLAPVISFKLAPYETVELTKIFASKFENANAGVTTSLDAIFITIVNSNPYQPEISAGIPILPTDTQEFIFWAGANSEINLNLGVQENLTVTGGAIKNAGFVAGDGQFISFIIEFTRYQKNEKNVWVSK